MCVCVGGGGGQYILFRGYGQQDLQYKHCLLQMNNHAFYSEGMDSRIYSTNTLSASDE